MRANFKESGKTPSTRDLLRIDTIGIEKYDENSFSNFEEY